MDPEDIRDAFAAQQANIDQLKASMTDPDNPLPDRLERFGVEVIETAEILHAYSGMSRWDTMAAVSMSVIGSLEEWVRDE